MASNNGATASTGAYAYEAPAVKVIGSVESITLSSRSGSFSDFRGRSDKKS